MKKRLPLILIALTVVLLFALPLAVSAISAAGAANAPTEQFDFETGRTCWFDLSGTGIPGTVNDKLPDKALHYVPLHLRGHRQCLHAFAGSGTNGIGNGIQTFAVYFRIQHHAHRFVE